MKEWVQLDWVQQIYSRATVFYIEKLRPKSVHLKKVTEYNRKIVWFQKQQSRGR